MRACNRGTRPGLGIQGRPPGRRRSELRFVEEDELGRGGKVWRDGMEGRGSRKRGKNIAQNKQILGSLGDSEWSPESEDEHS